MCMSELFLKNLLLYEQGRKCSGDCLLWILWFGTSNIIRIVSNLYDLYRIWAVRALIDSCRILQCLAEQSLYFREAEQKMKTDSTNSINFVKKGL